MTNQLATRSETNIIEQVMILGDLSKLSPEQRVSYYTETCKSLGLNPMTKPFDYINLSGKLTLYAKKDATEQLRKINGVSIDPPNLQFQDDLLIVTVTGQDKSGRRDTDVGVVTIGSLKGDAKANAVMKAITKAKRRFTLSICGLGWIDESEIETIPDARPVVVTDNGVIVEHQAHTMTLEDALNRRTPRGAQYGELAREQIEYILTNAKQADDREAARLILDSWNAEPPMPEADAETPQD